MVAFSHFLVFFKHNRYIIISRSGIIMVKTKCKKCGYTWDYNGRLLRRTCPSCGYNWVVKKGRQTSSKTKNKDGKVVSSKEILEMVIELDRKVADFEKRFDEWIEKRRLC